MILFATHIAKHTTIRIGEIGFLLGAVAGAVLALSAIDAAREARRPGPRRTGPHSRFRPPDRRVALGQFVAVVRRVRQRPDASAA